MALRRNFTREYCRVNKLAEASPLYKVLEAGMYAIPKLSKVRRIVKEHAK